jgi:transketolase C-terminal domain/subunit
MAAPALVSVPMLQPLRFDVLKTLLDEDAVHTLVTVEEHHRATGLAAAVSRWIVDAGQAYRLVSLGIADEFVHAVKDLQGMRSHYGIASDQIRRAVEEAS